jgi:hypothetical protein
LLVVLAGAFAVFWSLATPLFVQADSWLTLLAGREIAASGLPREDTLAVMTAGRPWIDQQWLAHLGFYWLAALGGWKLVLLASVAALLAPLSIALVLARKRGGSIRSIALVAILCIPYITSFVRTQLWSHVLFVVLLALLAAESRRPSKRVLAAFPLLALWANLHGAVLVGAGLVALLGAGELAAVRRRQAPRGRDWARPLGLIAAPWLCVLVTPYGLSIVSYYESTVANPVFPEVLAEWMPPVATSVSGFAFFVLAGLALALVARRHRELTSFEIWTLGLSLIGGLLALRSIVWFAFASLVILPALLERDRGEPPPLVVRRFRIAAATTAALLGSASLVSSTLRADDHLARRWPDAVPVKVAEVLRAHPEARVLASYEFGDWLLFARPEVRGRIAFDGRWELLAPAETRSVWNYLEQTGEDWEQPAQGYRVLVLNPTTQQRLIETYDRWPGVRVLFRSDRVVVYERNGSVSATSRRR